MALVEEHNESNLTADPLLNKPKPKGPPLDDLLAVSSKIGYQLEDVKFAQYMDSIDPLRHLRNEFCYPKMKTLGLGKYLIMFYCNFCCIYIPAIMSHFDCVQYNRPREDCTFFLLG